MPVSKSRGATRKLGPISLGSKTVRFKIANLTRRYTVHEDLICRTSVYFKSRLQKHRKDVAAGCSICFDNLNSRIKDVVFCDECGQNFHEDCIDQWSRDRRQAAQQSTCPMCRAAWRVSPSSDNLQLERNLDAEAVQVYIDWLYSGTLHINSSISRTTETFNLALLQCWEVSTAFEDSSFQDIVVQTFFTEAKAHFWSKSIEFTFEHQHGSNEMRDFIADIFMTRLEGDWFEKESEKWPVALVKKVADRCLKAAIPGKKRKSFEEIKAEYLQPVEEADAEEAVGLVSENDTDNVPLSILTHDTQLHDQAEARLRDAEGASQGIVHARAPKYRKRTLADIYRRPGRA